MQVFTPQIRIRLATYKQLNELASKQRVSVIELVEKAVDAYYQKEIKKA